MVTCQRASENKEKRRHYVRRYSKLVAVYVRALHIHAHTQARGRAILLSRAAILLEAKRHGGQPPSTLRSAIDLLRPNFNDLVARELPLALPTSLALSAFTDHGKIGKRSRRAIEGILKGYAL